MHINFICLTHKFCDNQHFPVPSIILNIYPVTVSLKFLQMQNPNCLVMVDNCYGEFVETIEPPMVVCDILHPFVLIPQNKCKNMLLIGCRVQT